MDSPDSFGVGHCVGWLISPLAIFGSRWSVPSFIDGFC